MLSTRERDEFERSGLLRLPAAIPPAVIAEMRDRLWDFLADRQGIERDRPATWTIERPRHLQALRRAGAFNPMATDAVRGALDDLLGASAWQAPRAWGLPLVTFQSSDPRWTVPPSGWHVDSHGPDHELPGVTVFVFLTHVVAGGGGTVVLPESHRLFNRQIATAGIWRPAEVKAALSVEHRWLGDLWGRGAEPGRVARHPGEDAVADDARLRVLELAGAPGDVVLMHPRTLHAPAPNVRPAPRMMLVEIINRR